MVRLATDWGLAAGEINAFNYTFDVASKVREKAQYERSTTPRHRQSRSTALGKRLFGLTCPPLAPSM